MTTTNDLSELIDAATALFAQAETPAALENAKAVFLGRAGRVTELMKGLRSLDIEQKRRVAPPSTRPSRS